METVRASGGSLVVNFRIVSFQTIMTIWIFMTDTDKSWAI